MTERIRGRRGMALRQRRLERTHGLCEQCASRGITKPATIVDHIVPLALGGAEEDGNTQNLCDECNAIKTSYEAASQHGASFHPDWLKPSNIPLTIVSGPPCSGKTTFVKDSAKAGDIIICLDSIMTELRPDYTHWTNNRLDTPLLYRAVRVRNELLGSLSRLRHGRAWFIVSAPSQAERDWWQDKLGGDSVLLHPGVEECKRRADLRGTPLAKDGIDRWEKNARARWQPRQPKRKPTIGLDGWPIETEQTANAS